MGTRRRRSTSRLSRQLLRSHHKTVSVGLNTPSHCMRSVSPWRISSHTMTRPDCFNSLLSLRPKFEPCANWRSGVRNWLTKPVVPGNAYHARVVQASPGPQKNVCGPFRSLLLETWSQLPPPRSHQPTYRHLTCITQPRRLKTSKTDDQHAHNQRILTDTTENKHTTT
jgi:hypothetical protein